MKFQQWTSFEKHLAEASLGHLPLLYIAASPCSYERKLIFSQVVSAIQKQHPDACIERLDVANLSMGAVIDQLNSRSVFGGPSLFVLDGIEKLKKAEIERLSSYAERPAPFSFLLLGASSSKSLTPLYQKGKKDLIALDLNDEKPWDRKTRLQRHLISCAHKEGKRLSPEAALYLLDHVSMDLALLEQEMNKLLCFCADLQEIGKEHIVKLCTHERSATTWQLSDAIIWETAPVSLPYVLELSWLLPFVGQLRYQLQLGLQLAYRSHQRAPMEEISREFPQMRGPILSKRLDFVRQYGKRYFRIALHQLFELELLLKNSAPNPALALDLYIAQLTHLKQSHDVAQASSFTASQFIG